MVAMAFWAVVWSLYSTKQYGGTPGWEVDKEGEAMIVHRITLDALHVIMHRSEMQK